VLAALPSSVSFEKAAWLRSGLSASCDSGRPTCTASSPVWNRQIDQLAKRADDAVTWTKVDDDTIDRLWDLSDAAFRLHVSALIYSGRRLLDGWIPASRIAGLIPRFDQGALNELVRGGYWRRAKGGWQLVDGLKDQPTKAVVLERREATKERLERWRAGNERPRNGVTNDAANGVGIASPGPSRPVPRRSSQVPVPSPTREPGTLHRNGAVELTGREEQAWAGFGPEWDEFRKAWLEHGFRLPPAGLKDDPKSQRGLLFEILDAWPNDLPRWIRAAKGHKSHEVVADVLKRWHAVRDEAVAAEELRQFRGRERPLGGS
jgi:hypothetical protein